MQCNSLFKNSFPEEGKLRSDLFTYGVVVVLAIVGLLTFGIQPAHAAADNDGTTFEVTVQSSGSGPNPSDDEYDVDFTNKSTFSKSAPGVLANDSHPNDDFLYVTEVKSGPSSGSVDLDSDGSFTYDPDSNSGSDQFTYEVSDGANTAQADVTINRKACPDLNDNKKDLYGGTPLGEIDVDVPAPGVLADDRDDSGNLYYIETPTGPEINPDADKLTVDDYEVTNSDFADYIENNWLTINEDGSYTYDAPIVGQYLEITYTASDADCSKKATLVLEVSGDACNDGIDNDNDGLVDLNDSLCEQKGSESDPPTAEDDSASTTKGAKLEKSAPGVLSNDIDPNGDSLSASLVSGPSDAASFSLDSDGSYSYDPGSDTNNDSFIYLAKDGTGGGDLAKVSITVTAQQAKSFACADGKDNDGDGLTDYPQDCECSAANDTSESPLGGCGTSGLNDDSYETQKNQTLSVSSPGVLKNDTVSDIQSVSLKQSGLNPGPTDGTVGSINNDGSFTYEPDTGFVGTDSFKYEVTACTNSVFGLCLSSNTYGPAKVTVDVTSTNDSPNASDDSANTTEGSTVTIDVQANDSDPNGNPITTDAITSGPSSGSATINADGTITYDPGTGDTNNDSFQYEISDDSGSTDTAQVDVTVSSANTCPTADVQGKSSVNVGSTVTFTDDSSDPDGNSLTVTDWSIDSGSLDKDENDTPATEATETFTNPGTYTVSLEVTDGQCSDTFDHPVTVQNQSINLQPNTQTIWTVAKAPSTFESTKATINLKLTSVPLSTVSISTNSATIPSSAINLSQQGKTIKISVSGSDQVDAGTRQITVTANTSAASGVSDSATVNVRAQQFEEF